MVLLRLRELRLLPHRYQREARREPGRVAVAQRRRVESEAGAELLAAGAPPVTHRHGHRAVGMARRDHHRRVSGRAVQAQVDHVALLEAEARRVGGAEQRGVLPRQLGDGVGQFLQPAVVGQAAVVDLVIGDDVDLEPRRGLRRRLHRLRRGENRVVPDGRRLGLEGAPLDEAVGDPFLPGQLEERRVGRARGPEIAQLRPGGAVAFAEERRQHLRLARAGVERRDERLLERDGAVVRARIAPALQRVGRGKHPAGAVGRLVEVERAIHRRVHLRERLAEVEIERRAVDGVPGSDHHRIDHPLAHLLGQPSQRARARVHVVQCGPRLRRRCAAQRCVDGVRHGVQHGRLACAHRHQRAAPPANEIARQRIGELRLLPVEWKALCQRRVA